MNIKKLTSRGASLVVVAMTVASCSLFSSDPADPASCDPVSGDVGIALGALPAPFTDDDLDRTLDSIDELGATRVRIDFDWSAMEPVRGSVDFSGTDRLVAAITSRGMSVLGIITYTPPWAIAAGNDPTQSHTAPADPLTYGAFAGQLAEHYKSTVTDWEIWNEPNLGVFFLPRPDVSEYAELLDAAHREITAVQPDAVIVSGGLSPATDNGLDVAPETFTKGLYDAGAANDFDILGVHPYSFPEMPDDMSTSSYNLFVRLDIVRDVMAAAGDESKPMWLTEFGAPTGTSADAVSEEKQAAIIRTGICKARTDSRIGASFIYTIRDQGVDESDREDNFGLVRQDFSRKPAFDAVRSVIAQ